MANTGDNSVSRINPANNQVTETIKVGAGPVFLAYGADSIWVSNYNEGNGKNVTRINAVSNSKEATIQVGNGPSAIVLHGGSIWVALEGDDKVARINATDNTVAETIDVPLGAYQLLSAVDSLWAVGYMGKISRINTDKGEVVDTVDTGGRCEGIAYGENLIWVTDLTNGLMYLINPAKMAE